MSKQTKELERLQIVNEICYSWDQHPGEDQTPFRLFKLYLSFGKTRSYMRVANESERTYSGICKIAEQFNWKLRSDDYDNHHDREMMMKLDEEILYAKMRQMEIGIKLQELAAKGIDMLNEDIESLSANDVAKLSDTGVKIINLALGSATKIEESKVEAKIAVKVEEVDPEIAAAVGKMIAVKLSEAADKC